MRLQSWLTRLDYSTYPLQPFLNFETLMRKIPFWAWKIILARRLCSPAFKICECFDSETASGFKDFLTGFARVCPSPLRTVSASTRKPILKRSWALYRAVQAVSKAAAWSRHASLYTTNSIVLCSLVGRLQLKHRHLSDAKVQICPMVVCSASGWHSLAVPEITPYKNIAASYLQWFEPCSYNFFAEFQDPNSSGFFPSSHFVRQHVTRGVHQNTYGAGYIVWARTKPDEVKFDRHHTQATVWNKWALSPLRYLFGSLGTGSDLL
jgi:hypothetical protein